jgi:hypothetical protein
MKPSSQILTNIRELFRQNKKVKFLALLSWLVMAIILISADVFKISYPGLPYRDSPYVTIYLYWLGMAVFIYSMIMHLSRWARVICLLALTVAIIPFAFMTLIGTMHAPLTYCLYAYFMCIIAVAVTISFFILLIKELINSFKSRQLN